MSDNNTELGADARAGVSGAELLPMNQGQRRAYLFALVATNQARYLSQRSELELTAARAEGDEAAAEAVTARESAVRAAVEQEYAQWGVPWRSREAVLSQLVAGLRWQSDSPLLAEAAGLIADDYRKQWGVVIDPQQLAVTLDPEFDPDPRNDYDIAASLWQRETRALDIVATMRMNHDAKQAVAVALTEWRGEVFDPKDPLEHVNGAPQRRAQLATALAAAPLTVTERSTVEFTVDYLRGAAGIELLQTPVLVDPGEEAKGRVSQLITEFAKGTVAPQLIGTEIAVMTQADQHHAREVGKAVAAGRASEPAWPGYLDRDEVADKLRDYVQDAQDLHGDAAYVVTEHEWLRAEATRDNSEGLHHLGVQDEIGERIARMGAAREELRELRTSAIGLTAMEAAQIDCIIDDVDTGAIACVADMPELLWADERTKAELDQRRAGRAAAAVSRPVLARIDGLVADSGVVTAGSREAEKVRSASARLADSIYSIGCGAGGKTVDQQRGDFVARRAQLGVALAATAMQPADKRAIRDLVTDAARRAYELGKGAAVRGQCWRNREKETLAMRDDLIAQSQAATAGRTRPPRAETRCEATPASAPAVGAERRRALHTPEVGR